MYLPWCHKNWANHKWQRPFCPRHLGPTAHLQALLVNRDSRRAIPTCSEFGDTWQISTRYFDRPYILLFKGMRSVQSKNDFAMSLRIFAQVYPFAWCTMSARSQGAAEETKQQCTAASSFSCHLHLQINAVYDRCVMPSYTIPFQNW